jgi:AraC-like DNA-binding protein/quercetin dioxygenase-like cupin family protein
MEGPVYEFIAENVVYYTRHGTKPGTHLLYAGYVVYKPGGHIEHHTHGHYEICLFTEGIAEVRVGDQVYTVSPGDLLITKPGDLHSIDGLGVQWGKLYIGVDEIVPDELHTVFRDCDTKVFPDGLPLRDKFRGMISELRDRRFAMPASLEAMLTLLLIQIARIVVPGKRSDEKPGVDAVVKARIYLEESPYNDLTLAEVAAFTCTSKWHLSHLFPQQTGMTLRNYLKYVIMHRALRLLEDEQLTISDIAKELRYPSVQYFSTAFHKFWGYTPTHYRRTVRKRIPYRH